MAGVGFELKKLFKSEQGYLKSVRAYTVSAVVTEGPMLLNILLLLLMRFLMERYGATVREFDIFLYTITYLTIFSLIFANTALMFIDRYISDCIYKRELFHIIPSFFCLLFWMALFGGLAAFLYLMLLPVGNFYRLINLIQFSILMIIWAEVSYLSAVHQYMKVLIGFFASVLTAAGVGLICMAFSPLSLVMSALVGTTCGYLVMMLMFLFQILAFFPSGKFRIFQVFPALDHYKILIAIGFFMALGLYVHNFVVWASPYHNEIWRYGVFCTKYDIPTFFATLTISPMLVRFVVSVETNFYKAYREYFDGVQYGGTLEDIRIARKNMTSVLFREISQMIEIQFFSTILCATFLGNYLNKLGLDEEQTSIFRILCFGYCLYGLAKCLIILLLYFEDRGGALAASAWFVVTSGFFTWLFLDADRTYWGSGYLLAAFTTVILTAFRLWYFIQRLEYKVFLRQPLFFEEDDGFFTRISERAKKQEERFDKYMKEHYSDRLKERRPEGEKEE